MIELTRKQREIIQLMESKGAKIQIYLPETKPGCWFAMVAGTFVFGEWNGKHHLWGTKSYLTLHGLLRMLNRTYDYCHKSKTFYILPSTGGIALWLADVVDQAMVLNK